MGRKKIIVKPIDHDGTRRATFDKRRIGVLKKAMELSILCKCDVSLTINTKEIGDNDVFIYSNRPYADIVNDFKSYSGGYRLYTNNDHQNLIPGKANSYKCGHQLFKLGLNDNKITFNENVTQLSLLYPNNNNINMEELNKLKQKEFLKTQQQLASTNAAALAMAYPNLNNNTNNLNNINNMFRVNFGNKPNVGMIRNVTAIPSNLNFGYNLLSTNSNGILNRVNLPTTVPVALNLPIPISGSHSASNGIVINQINNKKNDLNEISFEEYLESNKVNLNKNTPKNGSNVTTMPQLENAISPKNSNQTKEQQNKIIQKETQNAASPTKAA